MHKVHDVTDAPRDTQEGLGGRSLGYKAALVASLIFILATSNIVVVNRIFSYSDYVAATVNVAGKIRMLSQKLAHDILVAAAGNPDMLEVARQDIQDFERARAALLEGGAVFGQQVRPFAAQAREQLEQIAALWQGYYPRVLALDPVLQGTDAARGFVLDAAAVRIIAQQSAALLAATERVLGTLVEDELAQRHQALLLLYALFALDALLLLVAYVAFRRHVLKPLVMLAEYCRELGRGNYAARISDSRRDEIGVLTRALNDSAIETHTLMRTLEQEHESLRRAESLFQGMANNAAVGVCVVLEDLSIRYANKTYSELLGHRTVDAVYATPVDMNYDQADRAPLVRLLRAYLNASPCAGEHVFTILRDDGGRVVVEVFGSAMDIGGTPAVVLVVLDITYRREAEAAARQATLVFESTSEAIVVTDAQGRIMNINPAFSVITGYTREEVVGQNMSMLSSGRQDRDFYRTLWSALSTAGHWRGDLWNRRKNGEEYAEHLTINAVFDDSGTVYGFVGVFSDITKKKHSEAFIWRQAHYDSLTGLPNRQHFQVRLQDAIAHASQGATAAALLMLDLDFFKTINDTLGHDMGDELLRQVATRLSQSVREVDTVARLGGDEFTLIIVDISDVSVVGRIVREILHKLSAPYALGEHTAEISASMGITLYPEDGRDPAELLKNADLAMYAAKESGRNQYRRFIPAMRQAALVHRQMQRDLLVALNEQQFFMLYQPIIRLSDGCITQVEALLHWHHPTHGPLDAQHFMPYADEVELLRHISDWVFLEATTQWSVWQRSVAADIGIGIDLPPTHLFQDGAGIEAWQAHLDELGMPSDRLIIEITESVLNDMNDNVRQGLAVLRDMGVRVTLDNFGTGNASLMSLNRIMIDFFKIDASLIRRLDGQGDSDALALCQVMIDMAHKFGLEVIADGVETAAQSAILQRAGCDYGQGNYYGEPLRVSQLMAMLA